MAITFNPQLKMTSNVAFKQAKTNNTEHPSGSENPLAISKEKEPKVANFASKIAYVWINMAETTKGIAKGLFAGCAVGTIIAGADAIISGIKKKAYKQIFTKPTKAMGRVGKIGAPLAGLTVFAGYLVAARLKSNKRTANVDHQLYTNHRAK